MRPQLIYRCLSTTVVILLLFGSGAFFYRSETVQQLTETIQQFFASGPNYQLATAEPAPARVAPRDAPALAAASPAQTNTLSSINAELETEAMQVSGVRARLNERASPKRLADDYQTLAQILIRAQVQVQRLIELEASRPMEPAKIIFPPNEPVPQSRYLVQSAASVDQKIDWSLLVSIVALLVAMTIMLFGDNLAPRFIRRDPVLAKSHSVIGELPPGRDENPSTN
jgi:hypothetical protein